MPSCIVRLTCLIFNIQSISTRRLGMLPAYSFLCLSCLSCLSWFLTRDDGNFVHNHVHICVGFRRFGSIVSITHEGVSIGLGSLARHRLRFLFISLLLFNHGCQLIDVWVEWVWLSNTSGCLQWRQYFLEKAPNSSIMHMCCSCAHLFISLVALLTVMVSKITFCHPSSEVTERRQSCQTWLDLMRDC